MEIPDWLSGNLEEKDLIGIREAIERAEKRTSGEVVALVVRRSTPFGHVRVLLFTILALLFLTVSDQVATAMHAPASYSGLGALVLASAIAFAFGSTDFIRRLLTAKGDLASSVHHRAELEFHQTGIPATEGRTGVLIMVSMAERRAVILGDMAISEKIPESVWVKTIAGLLERFKAGDFRGGLVGAIDEMGPILAREFPVQPDDRNELTDHLIIKE